MIDQRKITLLPAVAIIALLVASFVTVTIQFGQKVSAQSSNPLAKVPVIGKLMSTGGANSTNSTSANSSSKNTTSTSQSSNPLAKVPVIGKLFGSK